MKIVTNSDSNMAIWFRPELGCPVSMLRYVSLDEIGHARILPGERSSQAVTQNYSNGTPDSAKDNGTKPTEGGSRMAWISMDSWGKGA
jgi:hypothetical protein